MKPGSQGENSATTNHIEEENAHKQTHQKPSGTHRLHETDYAKLPSDSQTSCVII